MIAPENLGAAVEYYQTAIQVQMHYNEMLLRVRSFGLTAAATLLAVAGGAAGAGAGQALGSEAVFEAAGVRLHVSAAFAFCALLLCSGLFLLDRFYYYRLFIASVKNVVSFEVDNAAALEAIGVRRTPMTLHLVNKVPQAWSDAFVVIYWALPIVISALFMAAAVR